MNRHIRTAACLLFLTLAASPMNAEPLLLVLNKQENTLVTIDPVTLKVLGRAATGNGPHEVAITADGKTAIVANYGDRAPGNSLSVIDLASMKETRRVDLGPLLRPHGIVELNGKIYFTSEVSRTVARYDPAADKLDWLMGTGGSVAHMLAITPDGKRLYTSNIGSANVTAINLGAPPNAANITQIAVGAQPEAIDISPDGREVWVGQISDGKLAIIDTATNIMKESFKVAEGPNRLKFTPDGKRVLVSDPKGGELILVDAVERKVLKRIKLDITPLGIQMQPDGKRAFISCTTAGEVAVLDLDKVEVVGRIKTGEGPDGLAWRK